MVAYHMPTTDFNFTPVTAYDRQPYTSGTSAYPLFQNGQSPALTIPPFTSTLLPNLNIAEQAYPSSSSLAPKYDSRARTTSNIGENFSITATSLSMVPTLLSSNSSSKEGKRKNELTKEEQPTKRNKESIEDQITPDLSPNSYKSVPFSKIHQIIFNSTLTPRKAIKNEGLTWDYALTFINKVSRELKESLREGEALKLIKPEDLRQKFLRKGLKYEAISQTFIITEFTFVEIFNFIQAKKKITFMLPIARSMGFSRTDYLLKRLANFVFVDGQPLSVKTLQMMTPEKFLEMCSLSEIDPGMYVLPYNGTMSKIILRKTPVHSQIITTASVLVEPPRAATQATFLTLWNQHRTITLATDQPSIEVQQATPQSQQHIPLTLQPTSESQQRPVMLRRGK